jgi:filamentous hemagglutinin family protein
MVVFRVARDLDRLSRSGLWLLPWLGTAAIAQAQVTPDGSFGTTVTTNGLEQTIGDGHRVGANLFHSFDQFSVPIGGAAIFDNALDITTIFGRVTGGQLSQIDGLIQAQGSANLFLLNPAGIVFGPEASLDIGGSFLATTADRIRFDGSAQFGLGTTTTELLQVQTPIGLQLGAGAGPIEVNGSLSVGKGQGLSLVANGVAINGGELWAPGGSVGLTSLNSGAVRLDRSGLPMGVESGTLGDVSVTGGLVSARSTRGGAIAIEAQNLLLTDSVLKSGVKGNGSLDVGSGAIDVKVADRLLLDNSLIESRVDVNSIGQGGHINITTGDLFAPRGGYISSSTRGVGNAGNVAINARGAVVFEGYTLDSEGYIDSYSGIESQVKFMAEGNGGDITINADSLEVRKGGYIVSDSVSKGNSGAINLNIRNDVRLSGYDADGYASAIQSGINTRFKSGQLSVGQGVSGGINLRTKRLELLDGSFFSVSSYANGDGGSIDIIATDSVLISGFDPSGASSRLSSNTGRDRGYTGPQGDGGIIHIVTPSLRLENAGLIRSSVFGDSQMPISPRIPQGGQVLIQAGMIDLQSGGQIYSTTTGIGNAGTVRLEADRLTMSGSRPIRDDRIIPDSETGLSELYNPVRPFNSSIILSGVYAVSGNRSPDEESLGQAGSIQIKAQQLAILDQAVITATSVQEAGSITIDAQQISLDRGTISAQSRAGDRGNIQITTPLLTLSNNSLISASAYRSATGGNISLRTQTLVGSGNSDILATAEQGQGGRIQIQANTTLGLAVRSQLTPQNDISASSKVGLDGTVQLQQFSSLPSKDLVNESGDLIKAPAPIGLGCSTTAIAALRVIGNGGMMASPVQTLGSAVLWGGTGAAVAAQSIQPVFGEMTLDRAVVARSLLPTCLAASQDESSDLN